MRIRPLAVLIVFSCLSSLAHAQKEADQPIDDQIWALKKQIKALELARGDEQPIAPNPTSTRPQDDVPAAEVKRSIRIYEVGDLITPRRSYPALRDSDLKREEMHLVPSADEAKSEEGPFGGGGAGFNVTEGMSLLVVTTADDLISVLQSTISPETWEAGGGENTIAPLGSSLVVKADGETHAQLADLLAQLRKQHESTRTVSIRSHWLWLTDEQLTKLLGDVAVPGKVRDAKGAFGLVDADRFKKHVAALDAEKDKQSAGYRSAITCFDGQTVHTVSGRQSNVTTDFIPVVGDGMNVAFRPVHAVVQEGAVLQILPRITTSGDALTLDIRSRVTIREPVADEETDKKTDRESYYQGARRMSAMIEKRVFRVHRLATTVRVPLDKPMLVGGMTEGEQPEPGKPCLYLFIQAAAQEQGDLRRRTAEVSRRSRSGIRKNSDG